MAPLTLRLSDSGLFLELGQAAENGFQGAARLAGFDHVDVQPVEGLGLLGHRLAQGRARLDVVADVDQAVLQAAGPSCCSFEDSQAAEDRQAGVLQDGQLPGEGGEHLAVHAADGEGLAALAAFLLVGRGLLGLLDGDLRHEVAHLANRGLRFFFAGGVDDVLDLLSGGVHRLELVGRHGSVWGEGSC